MSNPKFDPLKEVSKVIVQTNEVETLADAQTPFPAQATRFVVPPNGTEEDVKMVYRDSGHSTHTFPTEEYVDASVQTVQDNVDALAGTVSGFVSDDDPRLEDDRNPLPHTHDIVDVNGLAQDLADKVDTTDSRLSDDRNPLAHSHPVSDVNGLQDELDDKLERADLVGEVGVADLKSEVSDKLLPPNVFFVSTEPELLAALAYDGDRAVNVTTDLVVEAETITVGSGFCRITGLTSDAPNAVNLFSPTSQTTFTGSGTPFFECGVWCYDLHLDGVFPHFTNILPMETTISVTAVLHEKIFYERITVGTLTGAVQQRYWSNTYTPQPQSIGTTELKAESVTRDKLDNDLTSKFLYEPDESSVGQVATWVQVGATEYAYRPVPIPSSPLDNKIYAVQSPQEFREAAEAEGDRTIILQQPVTSIDDDLTFGGGNCSIIAPYAAHMGSGPTLYIPDDITIDGSRNIIFDGHLGISTNHDTGIPYTLTLNVPMYVASCSGGTVVNAPLYTMSNNDFYFGKKTQGNVEQIFWKAGWDQFVPTETTDMWDVFDQDDPRTVFPALDDSSFFARKFQGLITINAYWLGTSPSDHFSGVTLPIKDGWRGKVDGMSITFGTNAGSGAGSGALSSALLYLSGSVPSGQDISMVGLQLTYIAED